MDGYCGRTITGVVDIHWPAEMKKKKKKKIGILIMIILKLEHLGFLAHKLWTLEAPTWELKQNINDISMSCLTLIYGVLK